MKVRSSPKTIDIVGNGDLQHSRRPALATLPRRGSWLLQGLDHPKRFMGTCLENPNHKSTYNLFKRPRGLGVLGIIILILFLEVLRQIVVLGRILDDHLTI